VPGHVGHVLFAVAALLLAAKLGGLVAERLRQPAVLGELVTGIALGNGLAWSFGAEGLSVVRDDPTLHVLSEIGVLILLFDVGLEADLRAFRRVGPSSLLVAVVGVAVPFALGWAVSVWLMPDRSSLVHVFVGASLTATSLGITARVLKDLGVAQSPEGQTILGAALVDDVLGLVVLAVVTGSVTAAATGGDGFAWIDVAAICAKAIVFLALAVGAGYFLSARLVRLVGATGQGGLILVVGLSLCFTLAFVAEQIGLAAIVGAFAAGLVLDPFGVGVRATRDEDTLNELLHPLSAVFVPLFFVLMGFQVDLASLADSTALAIGGVLVVVAVAGKLACALGVVSSGMNRLAIAIGMVPRGEVGLVFAGVGASLLLDERPLLDQALFSALVSMVVVTTLVTPPGLRWAFRRVRP
jgi:Kef-type K+ transport system membrane component KefB